MKLKQDHGGILNDFNDIRLRSSMRSRMSKSYIDELRGTHQQEMDLNNNGNSNRSSHCSISRTNSIQPKSISISFPTGKHETKILCSTCQSTVSLSDSDNEKNHATFDKSILINPNALENLTVEEIEKIAYEKDDMINDQSQIKPKLILKSAIKNNHRLTIPTVGDYCIRIPNTSSISTEQHQIESTETRLSDALGYLRMYKNHNRIQFNSLQFNDREDLQVKFKELNLFRKKKKTFEKFFL
jgi:hypothetical protein